LILYEKKFNDCPKREKGNIFLIKPKKPLAPVKPILSEIILKEQNKCDRDCSYILENDCFGRCGGEIKFEKVCIENCSN